MHLELFAPFPPPAAQLMSLFVGVARHCGHQIAPTEQFALVTARFGRATIPTVSSRPGASLPAAALFASNPARTPTFPITRPSCCSFSCGALHVPAHTLRRWRLDFDPVSVRSTPSTHIPSHAVCACHGPIGSHSLSCALVKLLAFKQSLASPSSYSVSASRHAHRHRVAGQL